MESKGTCLVLEGGALRGVYTAGVQEILYHNQVTADCLIGTSAGAMNAINFLSGQPERSFLIDYHFATDKQFMGLRPLLKEGQIFSFSYMFTAVNERFPLNMAAFTASPLRFMVIASDCQSGCPAYLERDNCSDMMKALQASSSMPLLSTPVALDGRRYLDGGPSMAVGYRKALEEGYGKVVLILTRQKGYRKSPFSPLFRMAIRRKFRKYPAFMEMMLSSPFRYNEMMDEIDRLEEEGVLFVLRPSEPVTVSRTEKDVSKLFHLYQLGKRDTEARLPALRDYLGGFS